MEGTRTGRNLEISKIDGRKWNWKAPGNLKKRWKELELEGTWKSQKEMERNGIGRNLEISILDGRKWNWKEAGNLKNEWKEMELEGTWNSQK